MARKRLSDLLREEAHKPREESADTSPTANGGRRKRSPSPEAEQTTPNEPAADDTATGNPVAIAPPDQPSVDELQAKLEQANQREVELIQRVHALQMELEQQTNRVQTLQLGLDQETSRVQTLQLDVEKMGPLKTELEQAKQAAMHLAQENTRLTQEIGELKKPQPSPPAPSAPPTTQAALTKTEAIRQQQTRALAHPVFPTSIPSPGHLSDKDLGWVD